MSRKKKRGTGQVVLGTFGIIALLVIAWLMMVDRDFVAGGARPPKKWEFWLWGLENTSGGEFA